MARDIEALQLQMSADLRRFERSMAAMRQTADRRLTEVENRARRADVNLDRIMGQAGRNMTDSFREGLRGIAPALAAAFSADQVIRYADAYTQLQNRLRVAGLEGERLVQVENALFDAANRNGIQVNATAELYSRLALSRDNLGASDAQLIDLVDGVTAALRVQGVSAEAASGPLLQLGQALGAGTVRAEELNSLLEGTPVLLQAAARGSTEYAGDVSRLAAAIREGEVSSQEFFRALLAGLPAIEQQAQESALTVGQSFQILNNEIGRYIGQTDQGLSATARMAQAISLLANNLEVVVTAAGIAVTVIGVRMVGALVLGTAEAIRYQFALLTMAAAQTGVSRTALLASASMAALRSSMLFLLTNPIGIAITAIAGALALLALRTDDATDSQNQLERSVDRTEKALDQYRRASEAAAQATAENRAEADRNAASMRAEAVAAIRSAIALRQRTAALRDQAVADAEAAEQRVRTAVGQAQTPLAQGEAARLNRIAEDARDAAREASDALGDALKGLYNIDNPTAGGGGAPPAAATTGGGSRGGGGPTAAEIAERRRLFDLEREIDRARSANNEREVARIQEQIDLIRLTADYRDAGYEDAAFQATQQLAAVNQATAAAEERARAEEWLAERLEARAEAEREAAQWADRTLQIDIEAARLAGDDRRVEQLEREADLRRRIAEYAERFGAVVGTGLALAEQSRLDGAAAEGELRDQAEAAAEGFVAILRADNIWEEIGNRFRNAAFDGIEDLFANIFRQLQASQGGGQGGGVVSAFLNFLGGSKYGGKRAGGGPVSPSRAYVVGENGPEVMVPNMAGRIVANAGPGKSGRMDVVHRVVVVPDEKSFISLAGDAAAPYAMAAYQGAENRRQQMMKSARRRKG